MSDYPRDLVGYGANPPDPHWPGGARLAVNFVMNIEEGSEYSIPDGDGFSETGLTESPGSPNDPGSRDLAAESMFEYGSRVGFWRLNRLFREREMPVTYFACALAVERNPEMAAAITESGNDICCHGWRWIEHFKLSREEEREHIRKAVGSLKKTLGHRPLGWYCRHGPGEATRELLVEEGGFLYDSDAYNDELPYWTEVKGTPHLVVPYSLVHNDSKFSRGWLNTGQQFFEFIRDGFDMLYAEGATQPKMMSIGLHTRLIGHPARAAGLARLLDYIKGFEDVWVTGRLDIARHWRETHPYR
jgi:putative urate catabolism protein